MSSARAQKFAGHVYRLYEVCLNKEFSILPGESSS
jgi:hypothetical protein